MFVTSQIAFECCAAHNSATNQDGITLSGKVALCSFTLDFLTCITFLAIGIIGTCGLIPTLSPAASYTLIGVAGFIAFTWLAIGMYTRGDIFVSVKKLFEAAIYKTGP